MCPSAINPKMSFPPRLWGWETLGPELGTYRYSFLQWIAYTLQTLDSVYNDPWFCLQRLLILSAVLWRLLSPQPQYVGLDLSGTLFHGWNFLQASGIQWSREWACYCHSIMDFHWIKGLMEFQSWALSPSPLPLPPLGTGSVSTFSSTKPSQGH